MKAKHWFTKMTATLLPGILLLVMGTPLCAQPAARFTAAPLNGCAPILVQFTDQSAGNPNYWKWDLGNGTTSYLQHPSATYLLPGLYTITLTVKNSAGQDSLAKTSYIEVFSAPDIRFSASATEACGPLQVQFTDESSSGNQWQWDFGDGIFSNLQHPAHTYTRNGSYHVSLKVKNSNGCASVKVQSGMINLRAVKAGFTQTVPLRCSPNRLRFSNTSTGAGNLRYQWDFGNGDSSTQKDPEYTYPAAGTYTVRLTVLNEAGCSDIFSLPVQVQMPVSAAFTVQEQRFCTVPAVARFSTAQQPGQRYAWDFGDSAFSNQATPGHVYTDTGRFTVTLRVSNAAGCADTVTESGFIRVYRPVVELYNLPDSGCIPFTHRFEAGITASDTITGWEWQFGDGQISHQQYPQHTYHTEGMYDIRLITTSRSGCRDTTLVTGGIKAGLRPQAAFSAERLSACAQSGILFTDQSTGSVNQWQWDFGDQTSEVVQHPEHIFTDTGHLDVQLIVFNNGCSDTLRKRGYVYILPAVAKFKYDFTCEDPHRFVFSNFSIGAEQWQWDLGDGTLTSERSPVHRYTDTGMYTARLMVTNSTTGCNFSLTKKLRVHAVDPDFYVSDSIACRGSELTFRSTLASQDATRFIWDFGDGDFASTTGNMVSHRYEQPGVYTVRLITINLVNCRDTVVKQQYIHVYGIRAGFETAATQTCANAPVLFSDHSGTEGDNRIRTWTWNYGDGSTETLQAPPFSHVYTRRGSFTVSLTVTDDRGCRDSVVSDIQLKVWQPDARFFSADTIRCSNTDALMICPYNETGVTYLWNFGDGSVSTQQNPRQRYSAAGSYTVSLIVTHPAGCADTITRPSYIRVEDPRAAFIMSDSFRSCPPLIVDFSNQSANGHTLEWNFGDGSATSFAAPSHIYAQPGIYPVTLTVTGRGGCSSRMESRVVVNGPSGTLSFDPQTYCKAPAQAVLRANTRDAVSYIWDFNDGVTVQHSDSVVQHVYREAGVYRPKLILSDNNGCRVSITAADTLRVHHLEAAFSLPVNRVCNDEPLAFSNTTQTTDPISSVEWSFGDGFFSNSLQDPIHQYRTTGVYQPQLVVHTAGGCTDTARSAQPVVIARDADVRIQAGDPGCAPLQMSFRAETLPGSEPVSSWSWDFGNGQRSSLPEPARQEYALAGTYNVLLTATTASGCSTQVVHTVNAYAAPLVQILGDTSVCSGRTVTLRASGAATYQWGNAAPCATCVENQVTPNVDTRYTLTGRNSQGCSAADTLDMQVKQPIRLTVNENRAICSGQSVKLQVAGGANYQWFPATGLDHASGATPRATPEVTTTYLVVSRDASGCSSDTGRVTITVHPNPSVDAGADRVIAAGSPAALTPILSADVTDLRWSPSGSIFRNEPGFVITVKPAQTTVYTAEATNQWGCRASDDVQIRVEAANGGLFIPNTFSPNGDGTNEVFYPRSTGSVTILRMKIFNRDGVPVFERTRFMSNDANAGWDGRSRGMMQPQDVYMYAVEIAGPDGKPQVVTGNISLIR